MQCVSTKMIKACHFDYSDVDAPCTTFDLENVVIVSYANWNGECPEYSLMTKAETEYYLQGSSPFALSASDGAILGGAILAVWATAFAFKALIKALNSGDPEN